MEGDCVRPAELVGEATDQDVKCTRGMQLNLSYQRPAGGHPRSVLIPALMMASYGRSLLHALQTVLGDTQTF